MYMYINTYFTYETRAYPIYIYVCFLTNDSNNWQANAIDTFPELF